MCRRSTFGYLYRISVGVDKQQKQKKTVSNLRHERRWQTIEKPSFTATIGRDKRIY